MPGFQKVNTHGTVVSMIGGEGRGVTLVAGVTSGRCQTLSETLAGGWQHDKGPMEGHFCLRRQQEHRDI